MSNLMFLWYDEEADWFNELATDYDEETGEVSVITTHFSKYMVVDKDKWFDAWEEEFDYNPNRNNLPHYTVLAIDCSGSMKKNDKISELPGASGLIKYCGRIKGAEEYIKHMSGDDRVAIVLFDSKAKVGKALTDDKEALVASLQDVYSSGGTSFDNALSCSYYLLRAYSSGEANRRIILLTDGESSYSTTLINTITKDGIEIDGIGLGSSSGLTKLRRLVDYAKGKYEHTTSADQLQELYQRIYMGDDFDTTDQDRDGLYDILEVKGIRLINGRIIYTDAEKNDTDGDGLLDGEEIDGKKPICFEKDLTMFGKPVYLKGYAFKYNSDPTNDDSDFDGLTDGNDSNGEDNRPLERGIYSEKEGKVVVGDLTIVSSTYNHIGHAFLLYQSYVNDSVNCSGLAGSYSIYRDSGLELHVDENTYNEEYIKTGVYNYFTIGNSMISNGRFPMAFEDANEVGDADAGGVYVNREFHNEFNKIDIYDNNMAYSKEVDVMQHDSMMECSRRWSYYNLVNHNCVVVAAKTWDSVFSGDGAWFLVEALPVDLKYQISELDGWKTVSLSEILFHWR